MPKAITKFNSILDLICFVCTLFNAVDTRVKNVITEVNPSIPSWNRSRKNRHVTVLWFDSY